MPHDGTFFKSSKYSCQNILCKTLLILDQDRYRAVDRLAPINVSELKQIPLEKQPIEICERKGLGHPDYICDAIMNDISVALSKEYLKQFGAVMHHNIDKGLLIAGEVETRLGGGRILNPMRIVFGDRATFAVNDVEVPVDEIVLDTAKKWISKNLRFVDPEKHVQYQIEIRRGSQALTDIFERKERVLGANDTSAAVGFAPATKTETIVLETERFLNSPEFKKRFPETGEDVKVMGLRRGDELNLTIAMAFIDRFIDSEESYFRRKDEVLNEICEFIKSKADYSSIKIELNSADRRGRGVNGMYLTVLGTSADGADCGQVGRGNRVNGIIPLNRPTCSEAAAGKNPVSHVGKIYNFLTYKIANRICEEVSGLEEVYVWLLSVIGQPIDQPKIASVQLLLSEGTRLSEVSEQVKEITASELENIVEFSEKLAYGLIPVC
jgi:S-adenosylmethionine synthetase